MLIQKFILIGIIVNIFNAVDASRLRDCKISRNNKPGNCVSIHLCPEAQYDLQYKRIQPDICHFNGFEPIICCAKKITQFPTKDNLDQERISIRRCKELYDIKFPTLARRLAREGLADLWNSENYYFHSTVIRKKPVETVTEFPFMTAIGWKRDNNTIEYKCGGFLVEKNYVVTAAHCATLGCDAPVVVKTGGDSLSKKGIDIPIEKIIIHPEYRNNQTYDDIAIFKLRKNSSHVPACLWQTENISSYPKGIALGYGDFQFDGKGSKNLLKVELNFYENDQCNHYYKPEPEYPSGLIRSQLCAGDQNSALNICQGDSGGPILIKTELNWPYIMGIISVGSGCVGQTPSIYTRISSYIDWIESIVWK